MGCKTCVRRHYKCDDQLPQCGRCKTAGRVCVRDNEIRFRQSSTCGTRKPSFPAGQIWLALPPKVDFIDITAEVQNVADAYNTDDTSWPLRAESILLTESSFTPTTRSPPSSIFTRTTAKTYASDSEDDSEASPKSNSDQLESCAPISVTRRSFSQSQLIDSISSAQTSSKIYLDPPQWPLEDPKEAELLHHFITKVATFFDFCDRDRHFATVVPQRARSCRTLLNALMALSARHTSQTIDLSLQAYIADQYQSECLRTLIPALDDSIAILDETLLATIVILRLLEELDVAIGVTDTQKHLHGSKGLARAQERIGMGSGLRQASFWACLRQEIYVSLKHQRPVQLNLQHYVNETGGLGLGDEGGWANRATLHCAEALQFSFGGEPRVRFQEVLERMKEWNRCKPESFQPFYCDETVQNSSGSGFPVIKYAADWHVMGAQYLTLGRILLVMHDPSIPKVGPTHRARIELVEKQVKRDIGVLCGVALSNLNTRAAMLIACMAIGLCGDCFTDRMEQEKLYNILLFTERQHGWPTTGAQAQMRECWGWTEILERNHTMNNLLDLI